MRNLLFKKYLPICLLVILLSLSLSIFAFTWNGSIGVYADQNEFVLDANRLSFDGKTEVSKKDTANLFQSGTDNEIIETQVSKAYPYVKLKASGYSDQIYGGDNDALKITIRLLFNKWPDMGYGGFSDDGTFISLKIYNSSDTNFENPIISAEEYGSVGNYIRTFQMSPAKVCNNRGKLQDFVIRIESDATSWSSALIIDYVKIVFSTGDEGKSKILYAGDCIIGKNPENIEDDGVVWTEAEGYSDTYIDGANYGGFYAYVDIPALVDLRKEKFTGATCVTESDGTETLLLKNAVFAFDVGIISADKYQQFIMDVLLTDKRAKGGHTLYLYGSNTEKFVDSNGEPTGYVSKVLIEDYEQGFHNKFQLEGEDINKLAGSDGTISNIYILYHGNTLDTSEEIVGLRNGSQIWVNKIQFIVSDEVESPTTRTDYSRYDISDIFPVGKKVNIENKATTKTGDFVSNAALNNVSIGELSFYVNMSSSDNIGFLFNAKGRNKINEYLDGGILFYLSNNEIEISSHIGGTTTKVVSKNNDNFFSGETLVKLECIPYYINSVQAGYYCALWINGNKMIFDYFGNDDLVVGTSFHLCYKAMDKDFTLSISSSKSEGYTSPEELMNVNINSEKILYSLDKTDIPLALYWYDTGFDELSNIVVDGKIARVNQEVKRVNFNDNGTVQLSYSVSNVFGTFESNKLSITCDDVVKLEGEKSFYEGVWFILLCVLPFVVFSSIFITILLIKSKSAKKGELK